MAEMSDGEALHQLGKEAVADGEAFLKASSEGNEIEVERLRKKMRKYKTKLQEIMAKKGNS